MRMRIRWIATIVTLGLELGCAPTPAGDGDGSSASTGSPSTGATGLRTSTTTDVASSSGAVDSGTVAASTSDASTGLDDGASTTSTTSTTSGDSGDSGGSTGSSGTTGGETGLGVISGECGLIDAMELDSPSAFVIDNSIDFGRVGFDDDQLTPEGQQVFDAGNLGGSSLLSEVIAFEVLARCEGATLLATEAEIQYTDPMGIKTDILVEMDGRVVGVSVTRAVGFPFDAPYTEMQAASLLTGKLEDILASTANVAPRDAWVKQILHVIAYADMHAQSIAGAYATLPPEITADTILLVTVTDGDDAFVY